jgi:hypothetical protein
MLGACAQDPPHAGAHAAEHKDPVADHRPATDDPPELSGRVIPVHGRDRDREWEATPRRAWINAVHSRGDRDPFAARGAPSSVGGHSKHARTKTEHQRRSNQTSHEASLKGIGDSR